MTGPIAASRAARTRSRRALTAGLLAIAVIAALGTGAAIASTRVEADTARRVIGVHPLGPSVTADWRVGSRGVLVTESGRTRIVVRLTRASDARWTPALTGNFDGSGGGDAKLVTCTARGALWTVAMGESQMISLTCDTLVPPFVVKQMQNVYAGVR